MSNTNQDHSNQTSDDKLDMQSPDLVSQNFEKLAELFPNCVTESATGKSIDFDLLKQELNHAVVEGNKERYRLEWPGKREAIVTANLPTTKTLRPVREDSVDFDNTENIYIEGDNLEVLKLLQESYLGKIKMIYIDPPYNTGSDFVYKDNFATDKEEELLESGQKDELSQRLVVNPETSGRYHSDWLSMLYPRLKLARNLMTDDGVIFISIDDNEQVNLKKICDEIFGEENFVTTICIKMSHLSGVKMSHADKKPPKIKEYLFIYAKSRVGFSIRPIYELSNWEDSLGRYNQLITNMDEAYEMWKVVPVRQVAIKENIDVNNKQIFEKFLIDNAAKIFRTARNKSLEPTGIRGQFTKITTKTGLKKYVYNDEEVLFAIEKMIEIEGKLSPGNVLGDIWLDIGINNLHNEGEVEFKNGKKPLKLLKRCLDLVSNKNDVVLDFFSGSATTAHAVIQKNAEDNGKRKFIMVQLPEVIDEVSDSYLESYKNICEIGKERIRRAAKKIKDETSAEIDFGFRVYRLDESNMQDVYYRPQDLDQSKMDLFGDNVKPDRTEDDLLAQVMLDWGLPLSLKIDQANVAGKKVFKVAENSLFACFDKGIDEAFAKEIAKEKPLRIVFKDSGFKDDTAKTNVKQLLKQLSPETEMKVL